MSTKKSPIRVAIVQPIISPTREPWLKQLASHNNFIINVYTLRKSLKHRPGWGSKTSRDYTIVNVPSILIKEKWKFSSSMKPDKGGRIVPIGLTLKLMLYKPHVVIVTNATELLSALLLRTLYNTSIVLLAEDTPLSYSHISKKRRYFKRKLYNLADVVCAHSTQTLQLLDSLNISRDKIVFTPWAVDNEAFVANSISIDPDVIRDDLKLNGTVFVTIGSLTQRKGISNLLIAWNKANEFIKDNACLIIIGDGPEKDNIQKYIKVHHLDNVSLAGHMEPSEIASCLGASNVFVFPTLEDVWGLVTNEAMAVGLPVICSKNAGCCDDLIIENCNGNIYDPFDTDELTKLIIKYVDIYKTGELKEYGEKSKEIISNFTIERSVASISEIIDKL